MEESNFMKMHSNYHWEHRKPLDKVCAAPTRPNWSVTKASFNLKSQHFTAKSFISAFYDNADSLY